MSKPNMIPVTHPNWEEVIADPAIVRVGPAGIPVDHIRVSLEVVREARRAGGKMAAQIAWGNSVLRAFVDFEQAEEKARGDLAIVSQFVAECTVTAGSQNYEFSRDLYRAFCAWWGEDQGPSMTQVMMSHKLRALGFSKRLKNGGDYTGQAFFGLKLKAPEDRGGAR